MRLTDHILTAELAVLALLDDTPSRSVWRDTLAGPLLELILPRLSWLVEHARMSATPVDRDLLAVLNALNAADVAHDHARISAIGNAAPPPATVVDVRTPEDAGRAVGLTGRRIRQLCADGLVAHQRVGARTLLVDVDSLHAYLRRTTTGRRATS